eukprot:Gb_27368 [translate_table: standard]
MGGDGEPPVENVYLRDDIDLYLGLQHEIIWLQGEIAKFADDKPCKPALNAMLESLEKMVKDFKDVRHEEDVWVDSRPSHGDMPRIPRYVSDDEVKHMSVEDLCSLYKECRDYIHDTYVSARQGRYRTDYVDSAYDIEHGQASTIQTKHEEEPSVDFPSNPTMGIAFCTIILEVGHNMSLPKNVLGSQTHDPTTSSLGLNPTSIDDHHVSSRRFQKISEDPKDGDRSQSLRREIDAEDIVPPGDSVSS